MKVIFLGVGEAFDENNANTSILVDAGIKILLDCGYSIPPILWKKYPDTNYLDAVYLSHQHGDHVLGVPPLLGRMKEEKRSKLLIILGSDITIRSVRSVIHYTYPDILRQIPFHLQFKSINRYTKIGDVKFQRAVSRHSVENSAVRISFKGKSVCYSGDGMFTSETERLYKNTELLIHECYTYDKIVPNHVSFLKLPDLFDRCGVQKMALVHTHRLVKKNISQMKRHIMKSSRNILIPKAMDEIIIS